MQTRSDVTDIIRTMIVEEVVDPSLADSVDEGTPLLGGMVDSLGLMRIVTFVEEEFDIEIDEKDITATNFGTIADISRMVESKAG